MRLAKCQVCFQGHKKMPKYKSFVFCGSCKSFFFRAALYNKYSSYICREGPSCRIGHGRFCCKKCRYERCLDAQKNFINEDDLDALLKCENEIMVDQETEQFFDDLYKECLCK